MAGPSRYQPSTSSQTIPVARALGIGVVAVALVAVATAMGTYVVMGGPSAGGSDPSATPQGSLSASGGPDGLIDQLAAAEVRIEALEAENAQLVEQGAADGRRLERLRASVEAIQAGSDMLRQQIAELTAPQDPLPPTVEYGSAVRYAEDWFSGRQYLLVLDVLVQNPHDREVFFTPSDFELKAPDSTRYAILAESAVASQPRFSSGVESLPRGHVEIESQLLDPGESVRGSVVFYVTDADVVTFTVDYHGASTTITPR